MTLIVNGERIEDSAIHKEVERLRPDYERVFAEQSSEEREARLLDWSKENVVERVLIAQEARRSGDTIAVAEIESALARVKEQYGDREGLQNQFGTEDDEQIKAGIESQMLLERKLRQVCKDLPKPSQQAMQAYYTQNKEKFASGEQARVAHIVKYVNWQTDEESAHSTISRAHDELRNGAPFEVVADRYTDCGDGDLGYIMRGQMVEEFEDVVFNLGAGEVSGVFRTRFGFHIAKIYERVPATVLGFEEVKDRIRDALKEQMQEGAIEQFIDQLKSKAAIEEI